MRAREDRKRERRRHAPIPARLAGLPRGLRPESDERRESETGQRHTERRRSARRNRIEQERALLEESAQAGDRITVRLARVDIDRGFIDFEKV